MIEAKDLRVGNWYKQLNTGNYSQVDLFLFHELYDDETYSDHLQPIPLTPEILEKCGFTKAYESLHDGIVIMNLHNNGRLDFQYNTEYDKGIAVSNKGEDDGMMFPCQTLHQLQNLYYALTNEELKIKL